MTLQEKLIAKYGNPLKSEADKKAFEQKHMTLWVYPLDIQQVIPVLGKSVYCNKDFVEPYEKVLRALIHEGLHGEIKENDQCFMPRYQRGSRTQISIHTWGIAIDLNPTQNPIFSTREQCIVQGLRPFTEKFIQVWRDHDFVCGADFKGRSDIMHYQYTKHII